MRSLIYCLLCVVNSWAGTCLYSSETSRQGYFDLIQQYPRLIKSPGEAGKGEIEILTNNEQMAQVEASSAIDVGLIAKCKWGWMWINEACKFPDGHTGVFGRIVLAKTLGNTSGVAVMPMTQEGKIILICTFRHATRSWEIELPRGLVDASEGIETAAKREAMEETGMIVDDLIYLGEMPPDSGLTSTIVPIFLAKVIDQQKPQQESTEAIEVVLALTVDEIKQAFCNGFYECSIRGSKQRVPFRDPFLAFAFLMHELRK